MSTNVTCNSSFWSKEEDIILENALAMHFDDKDLLKKMEEALPEKSVDEILHHYNELVEDINAIELGSVQLRRYPEMQGNANQNLKADVKWQRGIPWTEHEHKLFLQGLEIYGKGDWRSISRHCVQSRTSTQVASHAQKFFKRHNAPYKRKRRASILDIVSVDAEAAGTFQVPNTEEMVGPACGGGSQVVTNSGNETDDMIGSACGGLQAVKNTKNDAEDMTGTASGGLQAVTNSKNEAEDMTGPASGDTRNGSTLPEESTNAEQQMIAVAGGIDDPMMEQEGANGAAYLVDTAEIGSDGIDDRKMEQEGANGTAFLVDTAGIGSDGIDDQMMEQEGANGTAFLVDTAEIGSDLEALLADPMEEDISSIFAPSSSYAAAEPPTFFVFPRLPSSNTPPDEEALRYVDDLFMD